ncbi:Syntaxin-6 [Achlya hypogyna]|uniref:Syntaxin-6 n=1 Tax=Achlya hypogyna TaxID=1202772 RepID=A0A1V9ZEE2_ACHHY|nr:Syntaxin-6 [Achlya hypogyna]
MEASLMAKSAGPSASGDPYYVFKEDLESKVSSLHAKYKRWKSLLDARDVSPTKDFPKLTDELTKELTTAERSLGFLEQSIRAIEADRAKYAHIDRVEVSSRKRFVSETRQDLLTMSSALTSDAAKNKVRRDERKMLQPLEAAPIDRNELFVDEKQRQAQIIKEQDASLDQLHTSVGRLGQVAVTIKTEVESQNTMLKDVDADLDDTTERMNFVMAKMSRLLKTKDTCQLSGIIFLTVVLLIMVFLVIYT